MDSASSPKAGQRPAGPVRATRDSSLWVMEEMSELVRLQVWKPGAV